MREITQLATFGECGDNEFVGKIVDGIWEVNKVLKKGNYELKNIRNGMVVAIRKQTMKRVYEGKISVSRLIHKHIVKQNNHRLLERN